MEEYITYFIGFVAGVVCIRLWDYFYGLGVSTLMVRSAIKDCLLMLAKNVQSAYEINQLKYIALESCDRGEKFIEFQKRIDTHELNSMKNTVVRNFINPIPKRFEHLIPFNDWDTAMQFLTNHINENKEEQK